jgi:methylenetetrahydrofolate--tRNA-(uracil-5-)-methyltransferase
LGGLHRNTFLNSPVLLDRQLRLKSAPHIRFAGQITGCEGYVESAAIGLLWRIDDSGRTSSGHLAGPAAHHRTGRPAQAHVTGDAEAETAISR